MSKAEKFIQGCTRNCSNEILIPLKDNKGYYTENYTPWLTPDQARKAVEIAREEMIEKGIEFNTLVDVLSKIDHDYKARLEIVDELIRLAYQIRKAGRASKEDTDKILCFYGFLHTLYSHQIYPHRITQERVDRKAMEVGKRNYQDNPFVSHCSYPFKSVDEIKKQYSESMVELKRIFNK